MATPQVVLSATQAATVLAARRAMRTSHYMDLGTAGTDSMSINIGRLEIAVEALLRLVDELTGTEGQ